MLSYGTKVRSVRGRIPWGSVGIVVGYGSLVWPTSDNISGDAGIPQSVYLVQVQEGSLSLTPACVVMRTDMVEKVE